MVCVIGRVRDDMTDALETFDQATRLRAIAPMAGRDCEPDRQAERINRRMDFGRQAASGAADTGSFKPPF
ncbi:hypothetical protein GCM10011315_44080 [Roseovarius pacificus]|nr:hypothetical protein GCM10011315_44080 [Roseovarius pacificus]